MERQKLFLSTVMCSLLFSYGSVASTHMFSQSTSNQRMLTQSSYDGSNFEAGIAATSGIVEFAIPANSFQGELGSGFGSDQADSSVNRSLLWRATSKRQDINSMPVKSSEFTPEDNSTLLLITLGFAALGLSRRRIKHSALANSAPGCMEESYSMNTEAHHLNSSRFRLFGMDTQSISATTNDAFVEDTSNTPEPVHTAAERKTDRNPYPQLALSVQKLEALADEMAHLN